MSLNGNFVPHECEVCAWLVMIIVARRTWTWQTATATTANRLRNACCERNQWDANGIDLADMKWNIFYEPSAFNRHAGSYRSLRMCARWLYWPRIKFFHFIGVAGFQIGCICCCCRPTMSLFLILRECVCVCVSKPQRHVFIYFTTHIYTPHTHTCTQAHSNDTQLPLRLARPLYGGLLCN